MSCPSARALARRCARNRDIHIELGSPEFTLNARGQFEWPLGETIRRRASHHRPDTFPIKLAASGQQRVRSLVHARVVQARRVRLARVSGIEIPAKADQGSNSTRSAAQCEGWSCPCGSHAMLRAVFSHGLASGAGSEGIIHADGPTCASTRAVVALASTAIAAPNYAQRQYAHR
jgi:hypothetical protein